jgi:adenylate kinase
MTKSVVALVGISGVGKSTLLRAAAETIQFQHLQASALIKAAKEKQTAETVVTDDLRTADITDNQALLVQGFSDARDPSKTLIVLDGHTVIDTPNGLVTIEPKVFEALGVTQFIFIADEVATIALRRANDQTRNRPQRSASELSHHQEQALLAAFNAAIAIGVPLYIFTTTKFEEIRGVLAHAAATSPTEHT